MTTAAPVRVGSQTPTFMWVPPAATSAGQEAIECAALAGVVLDPWQQLVLTGGLGERPGGKWAAFEVGVVVGRQNGKGGVIEARELAGLFVFGERLILHSAHEFKTSGEAFRRILDLIESVPDFDREVARVSRSKGEEGVELRSKQRLRFMARTGGSGRGFTGDVIILDEAMKGLGPEEMGAMLPTLAARPNPQVWYFGSAGLIDSIQLASVRKRGYARDPGLAFCEWAIAEPVYDRSGRLVSGDDPEDVENWYRTNPGLGIRISLDYVERERSAMDGRVWARERLGWGQYPAEDGWAVLSEQLWEELLDPGSQPAGRVGVAVDATPGGVFGSVGVAGRRADGRLHTERIEGRRGTAWMAEYVAGVCERNDVCVVVVDPRGPASHVAQQLRDLGVEVYEPATAEVVAWCGAWYEAATDRRDLRHLGQDALTAAVAGATRKDLGDGQFAWARKKTSTDLSPLVATTLALGGFLTKGAEQEVQPWVMYG